MHLSTYTRPDITYAVHKLCQYNTNPSIHHMCAVKHLLRYLKGTSHYSFTYRHYSNKRPSFVYGYSDASGASDLDDRKSTSGYVFIYNGAPISWTSRKQRPVALSTMESEYIALAEAAKEAAFLRKLIITFGNDPAPRIHIRTDSDSALKYVKNNVNHPWSKHIDTRHHYVREAYHNSIIDITFISSELQKADILTKPLGTNKHEQAIKMLMLRDRRSN